MTTNAKAASIGLDDEAVLLVGHGSRREKSNEQVRTLAADLEGRLGVPVDAGYLELAKPSIPDAIAGLASSVSRITVVQLSLFAASHVKNDVPLAVQNARSEHPGITIHNGAHPALVNLLDNRAAAVEGELGLDARGELSDAQRDVVEGMADAIVDQLLAGGTRQREVASSYGIPAITNVGRRGGSGLAAGLTNELVHVASDVRSGEVDIS